MRTVFRNSNTKKKTRTIHFAEDSMKYNLHKIHEASRAGAPLLTTTINYYEAVKI
jgi:hypothetical protein